MKSGWNGKGKNLFRLGMVCCIVAFFVGCDDYPTRPGEGFYYYPGFRDWWRIPLVYPYQICILESFDRGYFEKYNPSSLVASPNGNVLISSVTAFAETGKYWLFKDGKNFFSFDIPAERIRRFDSEGALTVFLEEEKLSPPAWKDLSALYKERWRAVDRITKNLVRSFFTQRRNYYGRRIPLKMPWQMVIEGDTAFIGKYDVSQAVSNLLPPQESERWVEGIGAADFEKTFVAFRWTGGEKPFGCLIYATGSVVDFETREELAGFARLNYPDITLSELMPVGDFHDLMWRAIEKIRQTDPPLSPGQSIRTPSLSYMKR